MGMVAAALVGTIAAANRVTVAHLNREWTHPRRVLEAAAAGGLLEPVRDGDLLYPITGYGDRPWHRAELFLMHAGKRVEMATFEQATSGVDRPRVIAYASEGVDRGWVALARPESGRRGDVALRARVFVEHPRGGPHRSMGYFPTQREAVEVSALTVTGAARRWTAHSDALRELSAGNGWTIYAVESREPFVVTSLRARTRVGSPEW